MDFTRAINLLNKFYDLTRQNYSIRVFKDWSGYIVNNDEVEVLKFKDLEHLYYQLEELVTGSQTLSPEASLAQRKALVDLMLTRLQSHALF